MTTHPPFRRALRLGLVLPAALALFAAAACGGDSGDDASPTGIATKPVTTAPNGGDNGNGNGEGEPVSIVMTDNVFTPSEITIPVNTEVEITVENKGVAVHNMHVQSKDVEGKDFTSDLLVNPGASSTFEVEFTKTGTYNFICDYHQPGMAGVITVE